MVAGRRPWQAVAGRGRPRQAAEAVAGRGRPWQAVAGRGRPWQAVAGRGRPRPAAGPNEAVSLGIGGRCGLLVSLVPLGELLHLLQPPRVLGDAHPTYPCPPYLPCPDDDQTPARHDHGRTASLPFHGLGTDRLLGHACHEFFGRSSGCSHVLALDATAWRAGITSTDPATAQ